MLEWAAQWLVLGWCVIQVCPMAEKRPLVNCQASQEVTALIRNPFDCKVQKNLINSGFTKQ